MPPVLVQLQPDGRAEFAGLSFKERLAQALAEVGADASARIVAVVVEVEPVADGRPIGTKLRNVLKHWGRKCGLRAAWTVPPVRPKTKPKGRKNRKPTGRV